MMQVELAAKRPFSLWEVFKRFKTKISITFLLVIAESILDLLFPLFIGFAINTLLQQNFDGVLALGGLGVLALLIGSGRRFYDTRAYANIYTALASEMVVQEQANKTAVSATAARATLLTELVEFLENSVPAIVTSLIGLVGILIIIFSLSQPVFWAALGLFGFMSLIYLLSGKKNYQLNQAYNDQLEKQWSVLNSQKMDSINTHFGRMMHWNIKLSDLETLNFSLIWLGIIGLLVYAPIVVIDSGVTNYGLVFSLLMYVFQYIESVVALPLFAQQLIRLQEISSRLGSPQPTQTNHTGDHNEK
ncbi:MAG: ABC transporter six-transmembrane domain-containing protein [Chloroflexota bacterium]